ncbi:single-stranded-DNA-specific exonuclease RecJ [Parathermosynechococcus lividus]
MWQQLTTEVAAADFVAQVRALHPQAGASTAQLLWQRGIRREEVAAFLDWQAYCPTSPFEFPEMSVAMARLQQARQQQEKIAIWGDFDADGVTATAVLWEGLYRFFGQQLAGYYIPNRLQESHGLSAKGLQQLKQQGVSLVITCDTGCTNHAEIAFARTLGIEVIVTDHHTLALEPLGAVALINPRQLPPEHPLRPLSGVAVAYKFVEAVYETWPQHSAVPLESLLDLVAIGLITDLVELRAEARYLAQRGLEVLAKTPRPGLNALLATCRRQGNRVTDISFGIGPRINAVSRVAGNVKPLIELLTTLDPQHAQNIANAVEQANNSRRQLQGAIATEAHKKVAQLDLSTARVIVLTDENWSAGILGIVANELVTTYGRPAILLRTDPQTGMATGSARSGGTVDLYEALRTQQHLFVHFGGHPYAVGFSLKTADIPALTAALNDYLLHQQGTATAIAQPLTIDLEVPLSALGMPLFKELQLLEPFGLGNPQPRLFVRGVAIQNPKEDRVKHQSLVYTRFDLVEPQTAVRFPAVWWRHRVSDCPATTCDVVLELDEWNGRITANLVALRPSAANTITPAPVELIYDFRDRPEAAPQTGLRVETCPTSAAAWQHWVDRAQAQQQPLILAYTAPAELDPLSLWQTLVTRFKVASQQQRPLERSHLLAELELDEACFRSALTVFNTLGVEVHEQGEVLVCRWPQHPHPSPDTAPALAAFLAAIAEQQFRRRYFTQAPLQCLQRYGRG